MLRLCYKIHKKSKMRTDIHGNYVHAYTMLKVENPHYNMQREEYLKLVNFGAGVLSAKHKIEYNLIIPITLNEYYDLLEGDNEVVFITDEQIAEKKVIDPSEAYNPREEEAMTRLAHALTELLMAKDTKKEPS